MNTQKYHEILVIRFWAYLSDFKYYKVYSFRIKKYMLTNTPTSIKTMVQIGIVFSSILSKYLPPKRNAMIVTIICILIPVYCKKDMGGLPFGCLFAMCTIRVCLLCYIHATLTIKLSTTFNHQFIGLEVPLNHAGFL